MVVGAFIRVSPVSHKGKNLIANHGAEWRVINANPVVDVENRIPISPIGSTYIRWIHPVNDPVLKIEEIK